MPEFPYLVECTFNRLGVNQTKSEQTAFNQGRFEEVLGSLSRRLVEPTAVTRTVSELLSVPERLCLARHRTILRLSRDLHNRVCVVTTNFDTLLERAATDVDANVTAKDMSFAGQALPAPGSPGFSGIVHMHGRLADRELGLEQSQLILTSADYGDAYMRSGWASRFLFDLARCKVIVLVGYSANDAPVRYFLNVLEADRVRFPDLKPVYALVGYDSDPEKAIRSWDTLAVTPLPYCKVNGETGKTDHTPLWRDLAALAKVAERPKKLRRERATKILECPAAEASSTSRSELHWLFAGRRDLWTVALDSITDPAWFRFFQDEGLWSAEELAWIIPAWITKDFKNPERFECARDWQERLGRAFTEKIGERLHNANDLDEVWTGVWRLFCLGDSVRRDTSVYYRTKKQLASGIVLDSDLKRAVNLLAPRLVLHRRRHELYEEDGSQPIRRLSDLVSVQMKLLDRYRANELVDALSEIPERSGRILELATTELQSSLTLETELDLIGEKHDQNDFTVPSIEGHTQNEYREGVNFLIRLLVNCLPNARALDREHTRKLVIDWERLPGRIGLRLYLHAMRDPELFDVDDAMSALLSISDAHFWSMRREIALLLRDRAASVSLECISRVEERIRERGDAYYDNFQIEEGESDWRSHARDTTVWLRLKMLQESKALTAVGAAELSAITKRRPYLDRDVEDRDFFGSYTSEVRSIIGDPAPIVEAPPDDRLRVAHELMESPDSDKQEGWPAYCRSDPQGAFDSLSNSDLTTENKTLWDHFLSALAFGDEASKSVREDLSVKALEHLSEKDAETLQPMASRLCDLISFVPRDRVADVDGWLVKLRDMIIQQQIEPIESETDLYAKAINSSAGKLSEMLLIEIDARKKANQDPTEAQCDLIRSIVDDAGLAGQMGRTIFARSAAFLLSIDRPFFQKKFTTYINSETNEGAALRAVMLSYGAITPEVTFAFGEAIITGAIESEQTDEYATAIAANILRPALADLIDDDTVDWGLTASQVAQALRDAHPPIRRGALDVLAKWVQNDEAGPAVAWQRIVMPFFEKLWPKEREFLDVSFTNNLIDLVVASGGKFPKALELVRPYIRPYGHGHGSLHAIIVSKVYKNFPHETLELIWLVCGPKSRGSFYDLPEIIDKLIETEPDIEIDRRLQWLEQKAERYE